MMRESSGHPTRRRFLRTGVATLTLAGLPSLLRAEEPPNPYDGFTLGTQSYCFREFSAEQALKRTHELGLHSIEFFPKHVPQGSTPPQIIALRKLCQEFDVTPIAYGVQNFSRDHEANRKVFEFGKALGIRTFSADPDPDSFDSLDKLVEESKISVAIHPHGPQGDHLHRWYSAEVILAAVKDHHPLIGSCLDTGHLIRAEQLGKKLDPAEEIRLMGARNFGIHLKDHDNRKKIDVIFGQGELKVLEVLRALRDVKFKGFVSIEYEANPEDPSPDLHACLDIIKEAVKKLG